MRCVWGRSLGLLLFLIVSTLDVLPTQGGTPARGPKKWPNVVFLLADDLRADAVGGDRQRSRPDA